MISEIMSRTEYKYDYGDMQKIEYKYDYLVVGAGLFGATFAEQATKHGKRVLVIEKRNHIGGNLYTENIEGINVHKYGAHVFHTNDKRAFDYLSRFTEFNDYVHSPIANYQGEIYSLPFNMNTFREMWGVEKAEDARRIIDAQKGEVAGVPSNLEEQAISLVGRDIYEKLIKGYTEKQWGRSCKKLPASIIKRIPVRFTFDNNYFDAVYQGIPIGGYTRMIENMLSGIEVRLGTDYLENKKEYDDLAEKVIYSGAIDAYFNYSLGRLEYRTVRFETEILDMENYQGRSVVNYTDIETPWTRIIEHKWFEVCGSASGATLPDDSGFSRMNGKTVISREYSKEFKPGDEPHYPVNDEKNTILYEKYRKLSEKETNVIFGGRLGKYRYYDMDQIVLEALNLADREFVSDSL